MDNTEHDTPSDDFAAQSREKRTSLASEMWQWLKHNKKWWLLPILIMLLLLGMVVIAGASGLGPFIYPLG